MAKKEARVKFEGEGVECVMTIAYPAISKFLDVPVGQLFDEYGFTGYCHGMKQRFGDFRALEKDMTDQAKDREAFERASTYLEHLQAGGDWKMTPERDTTAIVIEAMVKLGHKKDLLEKAVAYNPDQVKTWRANAKVKAAIAKIRAEKAAKAAKEADEEEIEIEVEETEEEQQS